MSTDPFDRQSIQVRERPVSTDFNEGESLRHRVLMELLGLMTSGRTSIANDAAVLLPGLNDAGFYGAAFKARPGVGLQVVLDPGLGLFDDAVSTTGIGAPLYSGIDDTSSIKPLTLTAPEPIAVPVADLVNPRIDIIEVKYDRRLNNSISRDIFNPGTERFEPGLVTKTLAYNQNGRSSVNGIGSINYKTGAPNPVPVAPAVDAGYVKIAEVLVGAGAVAIAANVIKDLRRLLFWGGVGRLGFQVQGGAVLQFAAPPGVRIACFQNGGSTTEDIYVAVGDSTIFTQLQSVISMRQDRISPQAFAPDGNFGQAVVDLTIQGRAAACAPPLALAIGQPILLGNVAHLTDPAGPQHNDGRYDMLLDLGRS